jgi:putative glutamine amidotransferase
LAQSERAWHNKRIKAKKDVSCLQTEHPIRRHAAPPPPMKPNVLLPCDNRFTGGHPMHVLGHKYVIAVRDQADCLPIPLPATGHEDIAAYLALADGILLTGSPSNVHPSNFEQTVHDESLPLDIERDSATLPLIRRVIELGMPLLAICRGLQEINVALGGSLHQAIQEVPGRNDHRGAGGSPDASKDEVYAPAHSIEIVHSSRLASILNCPEIAVNSVHGQGIDRLADGLRVEAVAQDGQIEAVTIAGHHGFNLAVQWHPEWHAWENPDSIKIFAAFGEACRTWRKQKSSLSASTMQATNTTSTQPRKFA